MIEAPEARILAALLNKCLKGKSIVELVAGFTPHKFTFFNDDATRYPDIFVGKQISDAYAVGGMVVLAAGDELMVFTDGVNLSYLPAGAILPSRHQLLIGFDDDSCLTASVRMYGGIMHFRKSRPEGRLSEYYIVSASKPQVMSDDFTAEYFLSLIDAPHMQSKTAKAALATKQSIPGLGNGVLQDILYYAGIHPKTKVGKLSQSQKETLYHSVKDTLTEMFAQGGRSSETDIFGKRGGYIASLSKDTAGKVCKKCGYTIVKESYMGGAVYYCPGCQPLL